MAVVGHGGGGGNGEPNEHAVLVHIFLRLWASANRGVEGHVFLRGHGHDAGGMVVVVDAVHGAGASFFFCAVVRVVATIAVPPMLPPCHRVAHSIASSGAWFIAGARFFFFLECGAVGAKRGRVPGVCGGVAVARFLLRARRTKWGTPGASPWCGGPGSGSRGAVRARSGPQGREGRFDQIGRRAPKSVGPPLKARAKSVEFSRKTRAKFSNDRFGGRARG